MTHEQLAVLKIYIKAVAREEAVKQTLQHAQQFDYYSGLSESADTDKAEEVLNKLLLTE